jgi:hypothetical protein
MRDREAINRFCAFQVLGTEQYKGDMDVFLAKSLEKMNSLSEDKLENLRRVFQKSMWANYFLFGKHAFRKSLVSKDESVSRSVLNIALFDCCSVSFSNLDKSIIQEKSDLLKNTIKELINDEGFSQAITISTNGSKQVNKRFDDINAAIRKVL